MSTVDPSTQEPEVKKSRGLWSPRPGRIWIPACGPNDLSSTEREWALKPPPGMESEPLTWESIKRNLG